MPIQADNNDSMGLGVFNYRRIAQHYNLQLFLCSGLLTLSSANYSFDNQGLAQTQAMEAFIRRFGERTASGSYAIPSYFLSFMNGLVFAGFALGVWIGSVISDRYGRRMTVFVMSLWALCTATIMITAQHRVHMLISRILNYVYIGMELSTIPVFQSEIMPAPVRGFAVASYQQSFAWGGFIISIICRVTSPLQTDAAWRIPIGCFYIVPSIIASLIWFIPESPRWLVSRGRTPEAAAGLKRLRRHATDEDVQRMLLEIQEGLERESDKGSYAELFRGRNRRRTLIVMGSNFFAQATGNYAAIFVRSLGTVNPFDFSLALGGITWFGTTLSMILVDKYGRRPLMITGSAMQVVWLFAMGGAGMIMPQSDASKKAVISMLALFSFTHVTGWAALNYVVVGEMPEQKLRDKTQRVGAWTLIATNAAVALTIPYAVFEPGNLGSRVGFIYGSFAILACLFATLCIPEHKGRTLEEVNMFFEAKVPAWGSKHWVAPAPAGLDGRVAVRHGSEVHGRDEEEKEVQSSEAKGDGAPVVLPVVESKRE